MYVTKISQRTEKIQKHLFVDAHIYSISITWVNSELSNSFRSRVTSFGTMQKLVHTYRDLLLLCIKFFCAHMLLRSSKNFRSFARAQMCALRRYSFKRRRSRMSLRFPVSHASQEEKNQKPPLTYKFFGRNIISEGEISCNTI